MRDNMKVEFSIMIPENEDWSKINKDSIINTPITIEDKAIGVITEAIFDKSGSCFNCKGVIWSEFVGCEFMRKSNKEIILSSVVIE